MKKNRQTETAMLEHVKDAPRQAMIVATRLEDGTVLSTEADHTPMATEPAAAAEPTAEPTPEAPAESGTGEEIESDAS